MAGGLSVSAHSFVSNINIDRLEYDGFKPPQPDADPLAIGWSTTAFDQGYVNQTGYQSEDIICHRGSANAKAHARVSAGDVIHIQWNGWPESHKGPVMDYMASCGSGGCETVNKNALQFFKINEVGLINGSVAPGTWATDQLIANNNSWMVEVPSQVKPGFYVLRTEILSLHNASNPIGAQNYPQCFNLQIEGNGTLVPSGLPGQALYDPEDPSMNVDIYKGLSTYKIPGPTPIAAVETVPLSHPIPTGAGPIYTGTATTSVLRTASATPTATVRRLRRVHDMHV
ncbi:Uu.00g132250.m01.CDS01 [Anthostomella pinea]|uniref:lytic cellulose monooxygenase (C4-dehydrogenating) n=1 Tax=Anthostomella pinea TaxID=933095 RepID=A0AAI8VJS0_9PEZI|nr:Uu.00g132250.m01.CDS01 [Anthostomella pinea]